jgi:hypothetical protein
LVYLTPFPQQQGLAFNGGMTEDDEYQGCGNGHDLFKWVICLRRQRKIMEIFRVTGI